MGLFKLDTKVRICVPQDKMDTHYPLDKATGIVVPRKQWKGKRITDSVVVRFLSKPNDSKNVLAKLPIFPIPRSWLTVIDKIIKCTCKLKNLMIIGCTCGGIASERKAKATKRQVKDDNIRVRRL